MRHDYIFVQDFMSGCARVPDRKFTSLFGIFPYAVKYNSRVYGFSNELHGPFKVVVEDREGKFWMLANPFTEAALRTLVWL
jgi:hypothetical protein